MIHLEHVTKTFKTKDGDVHAVKDVSLKGKSTVLLVSQGLVNLH